MNSVENLYLHLTRACNLSCAYCYFSAGDALADELDTEEWISVLSDAVALAPKKVVFTGGEPLLRPDLLAIVGSMRRGPLSPLSCLATNGMLINEANVEAMTQAFDEIRISVDGFRDVNDGMRGSGTFQRSLKAFDLVLASGGNPVALITVTSKSLPGLKSFLHFLISRGIRRIRISPLKKAGRAAGWARIESFEEIKRIVEEFWTETFRIRLVPHGFDGINCGLGRYLTVYPDGSVYPCHLLAFQELCLGNVRTKGLALLVGDSELLNRWQVERFKEIPGCLSCEKEFQVGDCLGILAGVIPREELVTWLGGKVP